jgi:uncharacterized protein YigA (DUF484 family)
MTDTTGLTVAKVREQLSVLRTEKVRHSREISRLDAEIEALQAEFNAMTNDLAERVSDHAVMRYFERKLDINIDELKVSLIKEHIHKAKTNMKFQVKTIHGTLVFKNGFLVTII